MTWRAVFLLLLSTACIQDAAPRHASGAPCQSPQECDVVPCTCGDGTFVQAQHCINQRCQVDQEACPGACDGHGGWVRRDAGALFCSSHASCPVFSCTCEDGRVMSGQRCQQFQCLGQNSLCASLCYADVRADCGWPGENCDAGVPCCSQECAEGFCTSAPVRTPP